MRRITSIENKGDGLEGHASIGWVAFSPRIFAWVSAFGAILLVAIIYDRMPDTLPVTRWSSAPRSPFIALRIPLINLLSLVLIETLVRAILRSSQEAETRIVALALFLTLGLKSLIEGFEIFLLPWKPQMLTAILLIVIIVGISISILAGRRIIWGPAHQKLRFTAIEKTLSAISLLCIAALQIAVAF